MDPPAACRLACTRLSMTWPSSAMPELMPVWTALAIRLESTVNPATGEEPPLAEVIVVAEVGVGLRSP